MAPRNYELEYANYQGKPAQIANRAKRNAARSKMEAAGKVHKNDGLDVDHKKGVAKGNGNSNLRVQPKSVNRSFSRTKTAKKKSI